MWPAGVSMAKHGKHGRGARIPVTSGEQRPSRGVMVAVALFAALVVTGAWWVLTKSPNTIPSTAASAPGPGPGGKASTGAASTLDVVKGRWQRADGGYVLEIRSVGADGTLDAGYFNPSPIHVAQARVTSTEGAPRVFVELRDVNYPGSTYTLGYDPANDLLAGEYVPGGPAGALRRGVRPAAIGAAPRATAARAGIDRRGRGRSPS